MSVDHSARTFCVSSHFNSFAPDMINRISGAGTVVSSECDAVRTGSGPAADGGEDAFDVEECLAAAF